MAFCQARAGRRLRRRRERIVFRNNTTMLFGDAKKMVDGIVKAMG